MNGKYVPPALRGSAEEFTPAAARSDGYGDQRGGYPYQGGGGGGGGMGYQTNTRWQQDYPPVDGGYSGGPRGGGYPPQQGGYNRGGYGGQSGMGGGGYQQGGYQQGGYSGGGGGGGGGYQQGGYSNKSYGGGGYGGGGQNRSYGGGGGGGGGGGRSFGGGGGGGYEAQKNALGFHGDERPNPRLERELFHSGEGQTTGINFDKYDDIPVEVSEGCPSSVDEFSMEILGEQLFRNLQLSKFTRPTPVQKYSIPIGLTGGDMMACAQTGSGKTGGFLFPVITCMTRYGAKPEPDDRRGRATYISALVLAPTRELASQIFDEAQKFCYCTGIRPVVVYGGANIQNQQKELDRGADLLVATPGRLVDLIERGRIKLDCVRFLILDEADRMLDMGFEPQIRRIVQEENMPHDRQTFMFSATFPVEIQRLASDFMKNYVFVAVGRVGAASKDVTQTVVWKEQDEKCPYVIEVLTNLTTVGLVLIFVETKRGADYLEEMLYRQGFSTSSIHGDKSQREREEALKLFKTGRTPVLVATDVAARGLDIPNVTQVINFDMPSNIDDYVHRIGRTGRVGNVGNALSLFNEKNRNIGKELAELLIENDQVCPEWLERYAGHNNRGGGGRGRGRGGAKFGARDYRRDFSGGRGGGPGGGRGGGGGGPAGFNPSHASPSTGGPIGYTPGPVTVNAAPSIRYQDPNRSAMSSAPSAIPSGDNSAW